MDSPYARSLALVSQPSTLVRYDPSPPAPSPKPSVWQTYRELIAPAPTPTVDSPFHSAITGLRHNAEGAAVGALLGFLEAKLGSLDLAGKYPVDGIAALVLYLLSVRDAGKPGGLTEDIRAISQSLTTIAFYRKVKAAATPALPEAKPTVSGMSGHSAKTGKKDPIAALAEELGLTPKAA